MAVDVVVHPSGSPLESRPDRIDRYVLQDVLSMAMAPNMSFSLFAYSDFRVDGAIPKFGGLDGPPIYKTHLGGCAIYSETTVRSWLFAQRFFLPFSNRV